MYQTTGPRGHHLPEKGGTNVGQYYPDEREARVMSPVDLTKRHYDDLLPRGGGEEHPVDRLVSALPEIAKVDAAARRRASDGPACPVPITIAS